MRADTLTIDTRFRGPPRSGNGGYVCGCLARCIEGAASVRLLAPPPLERPLQIERDGEVAQLRDEAVRIAEARPSSFAIVVPPMPSFDEATAASRRYTGFRRHPFPGCFVCGPQRAAGDGMQLYAGPLGRDGIVAAPWSPGADLCSDGVVRSEFVWAALDCPGAFAVMPEDPERAIVLGQLDARIAALRPRGRALRGDRLADRDPGPQADRRHRDRRRQRRDRRLCEGDLDRGPRVGVPGCGR